MNTTRIAQMVADTAAAEQALTACLAGDDKLNTRLQSVYANMVARAGDGRYNTQVATDAFRRVVANAARVIYTDVGLMPDARAVDAVATRITEGFEKSVFTEEK